MNSGNLIHDVKPPFQEMSKKAETRRVPRGSVMEPGSWVFRRRRQGLSMSARNEVRGSFEERISTLIVLLFLSGMTLGARAAVGVPQVGSAPVIRVESNVVVVPTFVTYRQDGGPVSRLTVSDFRLLEDGQEQKIQRVSVERLYNRDLPDNFGAIDREWAWTPGQKWSTLKKEPVTAVTFDFYFLSYVPPHSTAGSCHQIQVKVNRKHVAVRWRSEYCQTGHSHSDPLDGTKFSKQMESDVISGKVEKLRLSLQAGFFYSDAKAARVYIILEFSPKEIKFHADPDGPFYKVGVLAMVYRKDGTLAARSSDINEDDGPVPDDQLDRLPAAYSLVRALMPDHHEAQIELLPGDYNLQVALSDGSKFGREQMPLTVDSY